MQRVTIVRYTTKPECAEDNAALSRAVFAELKSVMPPDLSYALFRNGAEFLHLFINYAADDSAALTELPSFKAFGAAVSERCIAAPEVSRHSLRLVDSYALASGRPA